MHTEVAAGVGALLRHRARVVRLAMAARWATGVPGV